MWESLLEVVLTRLDQGGASVLAHDEVAAFPETEIAALLARGILQETTRFGVAAAAACAVPVQHPSCRYEIGLPELIARIRNDNGLEGLPGRPSGRLVFLGERALSDGCRADVYLSLVNDDPSEFLAVCRKVRPAAPRPVVMLVPTPVGLSPLEVQWLAGWRIMVAPLLHYVTAARWTLPWERILESGVRGVSADPDRDAYCRVITRSGLRRLTKDQYQALLRSREDFDLFIDGMSREARCREGRGAPRVSRLTPKELGILADYLEAARPLRPRATRTGSRCLSSESACRLFEAARRKVDVKLGRYAYRAFRLHRNPTDRRLKAYEFAPPAELTYCLILPV